LVIWLLIVFVVILTGGDWICAAQLFGNLVKFIKKVPYSAIKPGVGSYHFNSKNALPSFPRRRESRRSHDGGKLNQVTGFPPPRE
jgi:hypothetical protein